MSIECEVQSSLPKSTTNDSVQGFLKESKFSYTRDFLLSFAKLDTCKELPNGFDSSILCELNDSSTGLSQSFRDSDSGRLNGNLTQPLWGNPEIGLLGRGVFQREPGSVTVTSAPKVEGSAYNLFNKSVAPYRPPHLCKMDLHSVRKNKDLCNDENFGSSNCLSPERAEEERRIESIEMMGREQKTIQEKQNNITDEQKENLDPDIATLQEDPRNNRGVVNKCNQSEECVVSSTPKHARRYSSIQSSAFRESLAPDFTSRSLEKSCDTKSLNHSLIAKHFDVKVDQTEFAEEETKPVGGISRGNETGKSEVYKALKEKVNEHDSTNFSLGRNEVPLPHKLMACVTPSAAYEICEQLLECDKSIVPPGVHKSEEIEQSIQSEESVQCMHHHCIQSYDIEDKQPNSASHSGASQDLLPLLTEGTDEIDSAAASEQELWLNPVGDCDEKPSVVNEICLPDEDSLITIDDFIPKDMVLMPDSNSTEVDMFASKTQVDVAWKLPALNVTLGQEGSDDVMGLRTSDGHLYTKQSYPQSHHSQTNQGGTSFHPFEVKSLDSKALPYNHPPHSGFPTHMLSDPFWDLYSESTRFDNPVAHPSLQPMQVPGKFPHQVTGLPSGALYHPINEMACNSRGLNQTHNSLLSYLQQIDGGFEIPSMVHNVGGNNNRAAFNNVPLEMDGTPKPMQPMWPWGRNV